MSVRSCSCRDKLLELQQQVSTFEENPVVYTTYGGMDDSEPPDSAILNHGFSEGRLRILVRSLTNEAYRLPLMHQSPTNDPE